MNKNLTRPEEIAIHYAEEMLHTLVHFNDAAENWLQKIKIATENLTKAYEKASNHYEREQKTISYLENHQKNYPTQAP